MAFLILILIGLPAAAVLSLSLILAGEKKDRRHSESEILNLSNNE